MGFAEVEVEMFIFWTKEAKSLFFQYWATNYGSPVYMKTIKWKHFPKTFVWTMIRWAGD